MKLIEGLLFIFDNFVLQYNDHEIIIKSAYRKRLA